MVDVVTLPEHTHTQLALSAAAEYVEQLAPTALDTRVLVEAAVRDHLASETGLIIVVSDHRLVVDDRRVIQFAPAEKTANVAITLFSVRQTPTPQAMIRLRNDSAKTSVKVKIIAGMNVISRGVDLPSRGQERDYFFDVPALEAVLEAQIDSNDDQPADDNAWLVRDGENSKVEVRTPISPELRRMLDAFARAPGQWNRSTGGDSRFGSRSRARNVRNCGAADVGEMSRGSVAAIGGPLTADVNWTAFPHDVRRRGTMPPGWSVAVSVGGQPIVAFQSDPVRRAWVGFDLSTNWSALPDFVIFWANLLTWTSPTKESFASHPIGELSADWRPVASSPVAVAGIWPGIYKREDGALRAFNVSPTVDEKRAVTTPDWPERVRLASGVSSQGVELMPSLLLAALGCMTVAAFTWPKASVRKFGPDFS